MSEKRFGLGFVLLFFLSFTILLIFSLGNQAEGSTASLPSLVDEPSQNLILSEETEEGKIILP
ncbi:MAG: hypothetical protein ABH950_08785, partial [Candidatus Altiarchaeota archaeon]